MTVTSRSLPHLDPMGRSESLSQTWPKLPQLVIEEFDRLWSKSDAYKERNRHRLRAFHDLAKPGLPEPQYLGWEHEMFEVCFQTVLCNLPLELWKRGEPSNEVIESAADIAIPSVRMDIAIELSRYLRPPLPRPREGCDMVHDVRAIDSEGEFNGWFRIGYQEQEVLNESFDKEQKIAYASTCMGLVAVDDVEEVRDVRVPFANAGGPDLWTRVDTDLADYLPHLCGGLVSMSFYHGFTARLFLLACHPVISAAAALQPATGLGPMQMVDTEGKTAVMFRMWKSGAIDAGVASSLYRLIGCDLIMRPDCFATLSERIQSPLMLVERANKD
jgi:hypothetical protein